MTVEHAQQLRERITFQRRDDDGRPGASGDWTDQFTLAARLKPRLSGNEDVIAGRMTGQQPYVMTVRSDKRSRSVNGAWRAYDARKGIGENNRPIRVFEILSMTDVGEDGRWLDFLVREGAPV
jgi:SPP1 family predicted phage head-tail adaptor